MGRNETNRNTFIKWSEFVNYPQNINGSITLNGVLYNLRSQFFLIEYYFFKIFDMNLSFRSPCHLEENRRRMNNLRNMLKLI